MLITGHKEEDGRTIWLMIGGDYDGWWTDSPAHPMNKVRPATPEELERAKRAFWNQT